MMSRARSSMIAPGPAGSLLSTNVAARITELADHAVHQVLVRRLCVRELVRQSHRLPLEGAHLMERLDLDPFDVPHRRDEACDALDVGGVVRLARNEGEAHPYRLRHGRQAFGEAKRRRHIAPGDAKIGLRIRALDVQEDQVDRGQIALVRAFTQETGGLHRGVQSHLPRALEYPAGKGDLHHRLAARNGQPATEITDGWRKAGETAQHLVDGYIGAVLEVPGVRVMAVGAAKETAGHE